MLNKNLVLISGACLFKREGDKKQSWLLVKRADADWELPKVIVRKGESSVRAILRIMGEKGGMTTRVLEEVGRAGGTTTVGGKTLPQRFIYYLMDVRQSSPEAIGFVDYSWMEFAQALRQLSSKREKLILKQARGELIKWRKNYQKR